MSSPPPFKLTVLLAEDSEDDAFFFRWAVRKCGVACEVIHVDNGGSAIEVLEQGIAPDGRRTPACPDVMFLDLKMPTFSGFEVLSWLREHPVDPPLPVYVLSGSEQRADRERAAQLGALDYFVKPLAPEILGHQLALCQTSGPELRAAVPVPLARSA